MPTCRRSLLLGVHWLSRCYGRVRRWFLTWVLNLHRDEGPGRFSLVSAHLRVRIRKHPTATIALHGRVRFRSDLGGDAPIILTLGRNSRLEFRGDFILGDGVQLILAPGARLVIGGRRQESNAGITCDSRIMVAQQIEIGEDFICAWQVFISDSDWHDSGSAANTVPVSIGNHVWVAHGASILKGSVIGDGCIIAAHTVVHRLTTPAQALVAGIPGRCLRQGVRWAGEIDPATR